MLQPWIEYDKLAGEQTAKLDETGFDPLAFAAKFTGLIGPAF
jgi:hypothetical protein